MSIKREGKKEFIRLGIQGALSCGNGCKDWAKQTAMILVLSEILESKGYGVDIVALYTGHLANIPNGKNGFNNEVGFTVPMKLSTERVDARKVGAIALKCMLRYYGFGIWSDIYGRESGKAYDTSSEMLELCDVDMLVMTTWSKKGSMSDQAEKIKLAVDKLTS